MVGQELFIQPELEAGQSEMYCMELSLSFIQRKAYNRTVTIGKLGEPEMLEQQRADSQSAEKEITVSFSPKVFKMLEEIAEKRGTSVIEVIEEAIGLEQSYQKALEEGGRMIIEGKNGQVWELRRD